MHAPGLWAYYPGHNQPALIIDTQTLWGDTVCRVWLPGRDVVVTVPASELEPPENADLSPEHMAYIVAAARVVEGLAQDVLLAPIESSVIPLPHQIMALSRAVSGDRVRYLLADEVGLGKTVEAGLIMRELKLRGLVRRTLLVAPKGLVTQWVAEMRLHFGEEFQLVEPEDLKAFSRLVGVGDGGFGAGSDGPVLPREPGNVWRLFPQVIVSMDAVKPLDKRRGWTAARVGEYNRQRFEDLVAAGWDLIIVDEAHRLGGSTDQVARFRLGRGLSEAAPYLLLLSATPHPGKSDAFWRLLSLLDREAFPDAQSVTRERIAPYVVRTEKRLAIDPDGKLLFQPRRTELVSVAWKESHAAQRLLYEAVTEYVRAGYNQALRDKRNYIGFLMILFQRLVVSSTRAIRTALERRLAHLSSPGEQWAMFPWYSGEEWADLDGQEQLETMLAAHFKGLRNERAEVRALLETAARCEEAGPDAKAMALLDCLYTLQSEEGDPDLKVLVFTEFVPTQEMLRRFLEERGFSVVCLNGSMTVEERQLVQETFAQKARVLVSTDAGGEGLNLQFCHVVINYDMPWNPMRLEQRIGRVDRIGQKHVVRAVNFTLEGSVENRVREVLEEKLAVILRELGVDKTGDVLDSASEAQAFDELYMKAIVDPARVEESVNSAVARLEEQARAARENASLLASPGNLDPMEARRLMTHPFFYWVERMTVSYLQSHGGAARRDGRLWHLTWPDGGVDAGVVFSVKDAGEVTGARQLTMEEPRVRRLLAGLTPFAPGQRIAVLGLYGIARGVVGYWSLWQISLCGPAEMKSRRIMPLFLSDGGSVFVPTARHIWDQLLTEDVVIRFTLDGPTSRDVSERVRIVAEEYGKPVYEALRQEYRLASEREREKVAQAFAARRRAVEQIARPQVRHHRLGRLAAEEVQRQKQLDSEAVVYPEMTPLILIRVESDG